MGAHRLVTAVLVAGALAGGGLLPLAMRTASAGPTGVGEAAAPGAAPRAEDCRCDAVITRNLAAGDLRLCAPAGVTLTVRTTCAPRPLHVVFVVNLADYAHMTAWWPSYAQAALKGLALARNPNVKAAVVWMDATSALTKMRLSNSDRDLGNALSPPTVSYGTHCFRCGLDRAIAVLRDGANEDPRLKAVVYMGGWPETGDLQADWVRGTGQVKSAGATMIAACPWSRSCKGLASFPWERHVSPGYFVDFSQAAKLGKLLEQLVDESLSQASGLTVSDLVPPDLSYIPDSAQPPPTHLDGTGRLHWDFPLPISRTITLTYQVRPLRLAVNRFDGGQVVVTDTQRPKVARTVLIPTGVITVSDPCLPPATPSALPSPTPVPTSTQPAPTDTPTSAPTAVMTPPATPTASSVPTAVPEPVYLPITLRERCTPGQRRVDVVLAMDASTTMLEPVAQGGTKLDAARMAAAGFLDLLRLDAGDQAALIAFNADVSVLVPLTADRMALLRAFSHIQVAPETRIHLAIEAARAALTGPRHNPGNVPVLVLLSDGHAIPESPEVAVERAAAAKAAGIVIFTIGPGDDVDVDALTRIATRPGYFYRAPDAGDLASIYATVAATIPCPPGIFWGGR